MFNHPLLKNAYEGCSEKLKLHALTLDQITEDIKALENYLSNFPLVGNTEVKIGSDIRPTSSSECQVFQEVISWDSDSKKISYKKYTKRGGVFYDMATPDWEDLISNDEVIFHNEELMLTKRLIGCSVDIRRRAIPFLGDLLNKITNHL